jgi:hypothetical protein
LRLNLRKINQVIREAWNKGQAVAVSGRGGKSSCYAWSDQIARDYFPDIRPEDVTRIAKGQARLHWDDEKREIVVVPTSIDAPDRPGSSIWLSFERPDGLRSEIEIEGSKVTSDMLDSAEDLFHTLTTGERPVIKNLYDLVAKAFDTTREEAKERITAAAYDMSKGTFDDRNRLA